MTTRILALALAAILAGCDTTSSSSVPSGAEAPRLTVTVLSGTKAAPVDSPVVRISWEHESSMNVGVMAKNSSDSILGYPGIIYNKPSGDTILSIPCKDSSRVFVIANGSRDSVFARDSSKTVYCK